MLSKSKFILGQQCAKSFWLDLNNVPPTNEEDDAAKDRLRAGDEVGEIAKDIFPGGKEVPYLIGNHKEMFEITKDLIKEGTTTIYEASFIYDDIFVRVDLMNKTDKGWDIYEVKSSTKIKNYHEYDASIQWHVLKELKLFTLNDVFIVTLNNQYEKEENIIPLKYFTIDPITNIANEKKNEVKDKILELKNISNLDKEPLVDIGSHCKKPHSCVYLDKCWPESMNDVDSIFRLYRLPLKKKLDFYNKGIDRFENIKDVSSLTSTQQNQFKAYQTQSPVIDKKKLDDFISKVEYPITYFDFETFTDAVPVFKKQRPHMQMPFQYSMHIQSSRDEILDINDPHPEFIANHLDDPRRQIAESLINNFPTSGTIMAYNESFEKGCIETLAEFCPDLESKLLDLNDRFLDLIIPFRGGAYYDSNFYGSFSIKKVLPALCPDDKNLDYKSLEISNGGLASSSYKKLRGQTDKEIAHTREELFKYCRLDTFAMYEIYRKLLSL